jgi:hypothetical protein
VISRPPRGWQQESLWPDEDLRLYRLDSDIAPGTPVHADITAALANLGFDLAGWQFDSAANSHFSRPTPGGGHVVCPVLTLAMRQASELVSVNNWDDTWSLTRPVRDAVNAVLARHGLTADYQSEQTFVFPVSWEHRSYFRIGAKLKPRVLELLAEFLPRRNPWLAAVEKQRGTKVYFGSYWGKEAGMLGQFNILFPSEAALDEARTCRKELRGRACDEMRKADRWGFCTNHAVDVAFYHSGMLNLPPLYRED